MLPRIPLRVICVTAPLAGSTSESVAISCISDEPPAVAPIAGDQLVATRDLVAGCDGRPRAAAEGGVLQRRPQLEAAEAGLVPAVPYQRGNAGRGDSAGLGDVIALEPEVLVVG